MSQIRTTKKIETMENLNLTKGLQIEVLLYRSTNNGIEQYWQDAVIERVSDHYVWFKGMGTQRVGKTTFLKSIPHFYRIKN